MLGSVKAGVSIFQRSYFALRMQLETLLSENHSKPLLTYFPGEQQDAHGSALMGYP